MRAAPPIQALSRGGGAWQALQLGLAALSATSLAYWAASRLFAPGLHVVLGAALYAVLAAFAAAGAARPVARSLHWDGAGWAVDVPGTGRVPGQVTVMLDLGDWMLLRLSPQSTAGTAPPIWLPMSRNDAGSAWHGLRAALHSPAASAEPAPVAVRGAGRDA